ncbi:MAG: HEAT repeat domain-containing protein [Planctomycetes bacterium]|uniref:HEAT repeat domain-containing protein n=1 Tax=Candidatus Wunengus sp. YC65 TaxID=3367701 RepID=UPI001D5CE6EB|nr:HEAT repeat domain-containing protein [Planctomycetota bacterium]
MTNNIPTNLPEDIKTEIETLFSSNQPTIESAVANLVKRGEKAAPEISYLVAGFIKRLRDEDSRIRDSAAIGLRTLALNKIKDMGAVEPLITALKDEVPYVRVEAAWTLQYLHDSRAVEPLIGALKDELGRVRDHAAEALRNIMDTRAVEPLIEALKEDESFNVRDTAAISLWKIKDTRAIEPLIDALKDDYVQTTARMALENLTGKYFGSDISKWPEWWQQNKESFEKSR